jgi:hypothetical protein
MRDDDFDDFDDLGDLDFDDDPEPMSGLVKALLLVSLSFAVASVLMLLAPAGG